MKKFLIALCAAVTILANGGLLLQPVYADAKSEVCQGVSGQAGGACGTGGADLSSVIRGVLNVLSVVAGIAAVIMIVVSGLRYITSSGEAQAVSGAKRTLIYAIVGLIVVAFSQVIVRVVLAKTQTP